MNDDSLTPEILEHYKKVQKLAYEAAEFTASQLYEGMTEKDAVQIMKKYLDNKGVDQYFHLPFAWFGERSAFTNFSIPLSYKTHQKKKITIPSLDNPLPHFGIEFQPSNKKLEKGMAVILDVAPALEGHAADIGYVTSFGNNEVVSQGKKDLLLFRELILKEAKSKKSMSEIYHSCDQLMQQLGYENCHSIYPQAVLGHKLGRIPRALPLKLSLLGFPLATFFYLFKQMILKLLGKGPGPLWNHASNQQLAPGLWAVEPHIGKDGIGLKFEEILVVTKDDVYWLDDSLPHTQVSS